MKKIFAFTFASMLLLTAFSQTFSVSIDEVVSAMRTGNAAVLARFFDNTVEIELPSKSSSYSKSQAEQVMKEFFNNNVVQRFEVKFKSEKAGNQYCIGNLQTKSGTFRTTIYMRQRGDALVVQEMKFENN